MVRRLERFEDERSELRIKLDGGGAAAEMNDYGRAMRRGAWEHQLAALEREITHAEDRLRSLLAAGPGPDEAA